MFKLVSLNENLLLVKLIIFLLISIKSKREINLSSFLMHEAFCLKNVRPCEICKMPIDQLVEFLSFSSSF